MLYLNKEHLEEIGTDWEGIISVIRDSVRIMNRGDYSQPLKPYLRYKDNRNRIIAMPAYIGGNIGLSGIKWISSFPSNIEHNLPRAHSVTILNEENTGKPICTINSNLISAIRTAAVSGLMIMEFLKVKDISKKIRLGIIGFGPIGRTHLKMIGSLFPERIERVDLFDLKGISGKSINSPMDDKINISDSWEECYCNADIFITCTVAEKPYVDKVPRKGSLQLNVSLRDFRPETRKYMDIIVVDDWDEICRQNTDIENMHKLEGLQKEDTLSVSDIICKDSLKHIDKESTVMFNPMGMAVFDIAVGAYYFNKALSGNVGISVPD
jgi:2,3-diaminopropionate biosynthesis protein SbnB